MSNAVQQRDAAQANSLCKLACRRGITWTPINGTLNGADERSMLHLITTEALCHGPAVCAGPRAGGLPCSTVHSLHTIS